MLVGNAPACVHRYDGLFDPGDLPIVDVEIFIEGLCREEGATATRALGELFKTAFNGAIDADRERGCFVCSVHMYTIYHKGGVAAQALRLAVEGDEFRHMFVALSISPEAVIWYKTARVKKKPERTKSSARWTLLPNLGADRAAYKII